jgi:hypothetical protein
VAGQLLEDGSAGGVGESTEDVIGVGQRHRQTITKRLWFVKSRAALFFGGGLVGDLLRSDHGGHRDPREEKPGALTLFPKETVNS